MLAALSAAKRRIAPRVPSRALLADGWLSGVGAVLALVTLAGTGLEAGLGWWWLDPAAALVVGAGAIAMSVALRQRSARPGPVSLPRSPKAGREETDEHEDRGPLDEPRTTSMASRATTPATHMPLVGGSPKPEEAVTSKAPGHPTTGWRELSSTTRDTSAAAFGSEQAQKLMADTGHMQETFGTTCEVLTVEEG